MKERDVSCRAFPLDTYEPHMGTLHTLYIELWCCQMLLFMLIVLLESCKQNIWQENTRRHLLQFVP